MQGLLTKCSSPVRVRNKATGEYIFVPCNHCRNCRHNNTAVWQQRLAKEHEYSASTLFFTLTYDNENIPALIHYDNGVFASCDERRNPSFQLDKYYKPINYDDRIPYIVSRSSSDRRVVGVVSKYDVQLFLKRLRRLVSYDTLNLLEGISQDDRQIRYMVVSEYGPTTYRPHLHGLLFFKHKTVSDAVQKSYIFKAWKLCSPERVDCSQVYGNAPDYVSKYICRDTRLPFILQVPEARTFKLFSRCPSIGCPSYGSTDVQNTAKTRDFTYPKVVESKTRGTYTVPLPIPKQFYRYWLPSWFEPSSLSREFLLHAVTEGVTYTRRQIKKLGISQNVVDISFIRQCLPNYINDVKRKHRLFDDNYINDATFNHFTFSDISHLLTDRERKYGVPTNRMAISRAVKFCLEQDCEPLDYVDLYFRFNTSLASRNIELSVNYENYAQGLSNMQLFLNLFPSFVLNLPQKWPLWNHDFYYILGRLEVEYGDLLAAYGLHPTDFYDWHGNILPYLEYENLRTYHTKFSEFNSFSNNVYDYDVTFEKRRKLNYLNSLKNTDYAIS